MAFVILAMGTILFLLVGFLLITLETRPTKQSKDYLDWYHKTNNGQTEPILSQEVTRTHLNQLY